MIEKISIFILFLFPLVFFHELGHFLFARLFGVRVEVFSLGFGPKLFKFKRNDTEYCWSLIPLGGYVKMFGDDPMKMDEIPESDRDVSFTYKSKWARFWIVFGGPLANFVFTYVIFFFLLFSGEKVPEIKLGVVNKDTILYTQGFRTGDSIKKVNEFNITDFTDIPFGESEKIFSVTVLRIGEEKKLKTEIFSKDFIGEIINNSPILRSLFIVNRHGEKFKIIKVFKNGVDIPVSNLDSLAENSADKIILEGNDNKQQELLLNTNDDFFKNMANLGYFPLDLRVKSINMNSPADKAAIKAGDVVFAINQVPISSFMQLKEVLNNSTVSECSVSIYSDGRIVDKILTPDIQIIDKKPVKLLGIYSDGEWLPPALIKTDSKGFFGSFVLAFSRTWGAIEKTILGFKKLITSEVSFKNIGGPISIGKVATDSFNTSITYFFQIMALISVNLGVINLFPIPVLDGGHIMFIILEILNRGPLSRRKMEIAQQFGLSILLLLTFAALFNDFSRLL